MTVIDGFAKQHRLQILKDPKTAPHIIPGRKGSVTCLSMARDCWSDGDAQCRHGP